MRINKKLKKYDKEGDSLRSGLILRFPNLFNDIIENADQIYALINTYVSRKDYQVIRSGLNSLYSIVFKYIDVRNGTFFPSCMIQDYDFSTDDFLNNIFEKLIAVQRVASKNKDLELSKEIIDCLSRIAIKCTEIRYTAKGTTDYTHCMLAVQYLQQSIEDSLNVDLVDIGINGSQCQKNIGLVLISKNAHIDIRMILDNLSKIAMYGIVKPKTPYLMSYPLQAYSQFLRFFIFNKDCWDDSLPECIFEKVQNIADMYVKVKEPLTSPISMEIDYSLGPFLQLSNKFAMPLIFSDSYKKVINKKTGDDEKKSIIRKIIKLGHEVWRFYDTLAKSAAKKESFLIHYISDDIHHITMSLTYFYQLDCIDCEQKEEIRKNIRWLISNYWRIYSYHKKITVSYESEILNNLLELGSRFHDLSLLDEIEGVIDIIVSIANSFLEKKVDSYGSKPIRILSKAVYLCILSGSEDLRDKFVALVNKDFWEKYIDKYNKESERLFKELLEINPEKIRRDGSFYFFEDRLLAKLDKEKILEFVVFLKDNLKAEEK